MPDEFQAPVAKHLHRYLSEFDFRYNNRVALGVNDQQRAIKALEGVKASASSTSSLTEPAPKHEPSRNRTRAQAEAQLELFPDYGGT